MEAYAFHGTKESLQRYVVTDDDRGNFPVGCYSLSIHDSDVAIVNSRARHAVPVHAQCKKLVSAP